jgi:hemoglobin/transferrin/lactoferrin receptor protein
MRVIRISDKGYQMGAASEFRISGGSCLLLRQREASLSLVAKPMCAALAIALASLSAAARAQDADGLGWLERKGAITVTATRSEKAVEDVPATVSVITAEQIEDNMIEDIKDLVRFEPGVSVKRAPSRFTAATSGSDARAGASGFNIRGLDGNRVLIQIDGIRVADAFSFGGQSVGRGDYVDLGLLKSVEILRGPASALYGSDGLAGAVSFVTADPEDYLGKDRSFAGQARAGYDSSDEQFTEGVVLAGRAGAWSALAAYTRRDGHELDNQGTIDTRDATRTTPNPQDSRSNALLGKLVWQPSDDTRLRLTIDHVDDRLATHVLTANNAASLDTRALDKTKRDRVGLDWRQDNLGFIDRLQLTAYWQKSENSQFSNEDRATLPDRTRINLFDNRTIGVAADLHSDFSTGSLTHRLVWGGDFSATRQEGVRDGTIPPFGESFPTRAFPVTDYTLLGAFIGDEIGIADGLLTLFPVLRFDHFKLDAKADPAIPTLTAIDRSGSRVSPKIGAVLKLDKGVRLFANYAQGFKAPAPSQVNQFFENPVGRYRTVPNADLKPETSRTFEGGVRLGSEAVAIDLTGFTGRYRNFISLEGVGIDPADGFLRFQNVNLGEVRISGFEARLQAQSRSGLTGNLAFSYAKGTANPGKADEAGLLSIDPAKLVMGIGYRDRGGRFGGEFIMTHSAGKSLGSTRKGGETSGCSATLPCIRPDAFTIIDATAFVKLGKALTLRAGVFNLFDKKYIWWSDVRPLAATTNAARTGNLDIIDSYTQPGRNVSVSLTARF